MILAGIFLIVVGAAANSVPWLSAGLVIAGIIALIVGLVRAATRPLFPGETESERKVSRRLAIGCLIVLAILLIALGLCLAALSSFNY